MDLFSSTLVMKDLSKVSGIILALSLRQLRNLML